MPTIIKQSPGPLFEVVDKTGLRVRTQALVCVKDSAVKLEAGQPVRVPKGLTLLPGRSYDVAITEAAELELQAVDSIIPPRLVIGGGHYAPGGCALRYDGGDEIPQWNPFSLWDRCWRPTCPNPRGMALVAGRFWADIWFMRRDPDIEGFPAEIRTGINAFEATRLADLLGKSLPTREEFELLALGVCERSASPDSDDRLRLDAPRTSRWGIMQATGTRWCWLRLQADPGDDLDVDHLRAGLAGGHWVDGASCGSRASLWSVAPWGSYVVIGARCRSDHLNLV